MKGSLNILAKAQPIFALPGFGLEKLGFLVDKLYELCELLKSTMETNLKYRRPLFWDIPEKDIERALVESDEWIISRVFQYGTLNDIFDVIELYGEEKVKTVLSESKMLPVTRAMAFLFFGLTKDNAA